MPRVKRENSYTKVYHIILRGVNKQDIFLDTKDFNKFIEILTITKEKHKYEIYVYCLMSNHIHLVIFDKIDKLSKIMQSIGVMYSMYFNKKYNRVGHLFQSRFLSKKIENREYLKTVCRYIHQNPLKAGIKNANNYKWSSYNEFIKEDIIINSEVVLSLFSLNKEEAKKEFIKFHQIKSNKEISDLFEYEMEGKINDEQLARYICEIAEEENVGRILEFNVEKRNKILAEIKKNKKIKSSQIARVLGINQKIIERIK